MFLIIDLLYLNIIEELKLNCNKNEIINKLKYFNKNLFEYSKNS